MTGDKDALLWALDQALTPGDEIAARALLDAAMALADPIRALADNDECNKLFESIRSEFGFVDYVRASGKAPSLGDFEKLIALLRWIIREFRDWRVADDREGHKLAALMVASRFADMNDILWDFYPSDFGGNDEILLALKYPITRCRSSFTMRGPGPAPIWEQEAIETLERAEAEGDWLTISEKWAQFEHALFPNFLLSQCVRYLYHFGREHLVEALSGINQTMIAMQVVATLSTSQRLVLGVTSENHFIQFCAVYHTFLDRPQSQLWDDDKQQSLVELLAKVAADGPRWKVWMEVFNRYPSRYPALQRALGLTLAGIPKAEVMAYIDAIILRSDDKGGRESIAECLRAFREVATPEQCHALWELAYERWARWQFGKGEHNNHLFQICDSQLDYAVVGYIVECMTPAQIDEEAAAIRAELSKLEQTWYTSFSDYTTEWYRLLSRNQPYAYVAVTGGCGDWLMKDKQYLPFDPKDNRHLMMMTHMKV